MPAVRTLLPLLPLVLLAMPAVARGGDAPWHFKDEFFPYLVKQVPQLLKNQDPNTGQFGTGVWIVTEQNAMYPLAAAWAIERKDNPYYHDPKILDAVMLAGDALIADMDETGQWVFRKEDGSTWGKIYMPWTYSRWIRSYSLIKDAMPADRREKWVKALTLGFEGISKTALDHVHNIPCHHAMGLYCAGKALDRPEWCEQASQFMHKVVEAQDPGGFWSENLGPVVGYNFVYTDAIGTYCAMSGDKSVIPALERAARFHANFTYPDGTSVATVDERQVYHASAPMPNVGFTFSDVGRGYIRQQWMPKKDAGQPLGADLAASYYLYGEEGPVTPPPSAGEHGMFVLGNRDAMTRRDKPWFVCLSAYHAPVPTSRWIQDRQNLLSLFHDDVGVILGGGNTKLQPLWSTFTVGDVKLLFHKPGDENPNFTPPPGIVHVPDEAKLDPDATTLHLDYGGVKVHVTADLADAGTAKLVYSLDGKTGETVAAHVPLLPKMGKPWKTASGRGGTLGDEPIHLAAGEAGEWLTLNKVKFLLPAGASIDWPVLPHDQYKKDGSSTPKDGRLVITIPLTTDAPQQTLGVQVP